MKEIGIYLITHEESGLAYVGQSNHIQNRWREHIKQLQNGSHHNRQLLDLWVKHGESAFDFSIVCIAPDGLSPLQRQRWLSGKEKEIYTDLLIEGKALNVADPDIVETAAAYKEFKLNEKNIIKDEKRQIREINKAVSAEIRTIESQLSALRSQLSTSSREEQQKKIAVESARSLLRRNTGWRRILLGATDTRAEAELVHFLNAAEAALSAAQLTKQELEDKINKMREEKKQLYRSYPRNSKRHMRRVSAYTALWTGNMSKRNTRIR